MEIIYNSQFFYVDGEVFSATGRSYEIQDRIGEGGNGAVYDCIDSSGNVYAIKFLLRLSRKNRTRFEREIALLHKAVHPHIIQYIDEGVTEATIGKHTSKELPFVIMERADKNLADYLRAEGKVDYRIYAAQFRGLCEALAELHNFAIHRDIKPENILIKGEKWLISDFGLCKFLNPEEDQMLTGVNEKIGPALWMSPEAISSYYFGEKLIGTYSDVFQLCAVFAFVLTRNYPGGLISDDDSLNTTPQIRRVILESLSNDYTKRPKDGRALADRYMNATYNVTGE